MTSRERVIEALNHAEPDRVPYDLGSTKVTGIHQIAYVRLREALGLPAREPVVFDLTQQLAVVDDDVLDALQVDVKGVFASPAANYQVPRWEDEDYRYYTDEWRITRRMPKVGGRWFDICGSPLANLRSPDDLDRHPWPDPLDPGRFAGARERAQAARDSGRAVIIGGLCGGMFELGQWLRGHENFFTDLAADLPVARRILDRVLHAKLAYWDRMLSEVGDLVDVAQEGEDLGAQQSLLISPRLYRNEIKPRQRELFGFIKSKAPVKLFLHSCGSVVSILEDLIEIGVDILNPVQVSAAGMDTKRLKSEFGDRITFWGGGVNTQQTLPFGTADEVAAEVRQRAADLSPGGGYVCTTVHNIQADVPPENILAMRKAIL